jgi:hypothetical protein
MKLREKVLLTTFFLFMAEAIIHYKIGNEDCLSESKKNKKILPPVKSIIKIGLVVGVFSVFNAIAIDYLEK